MIFINAFLIGFGATLGIEVAIGLSIAVLAIVGGIGKNERS